jgi:hypothetical protein
VLLRRAFILALFATATLGSAANAADPTLLVHFKFDETSGATAVDFSGNGNNGTVVSGASGPTWTAGRNSNGLRVAGLSAAGSRYVSIPWRSALQTPNGITVLAWVKFDQLPNSNMTIAGRYTNGTSDWLFSLFKNGNKLMFGIATASGWQQLSANIGGSTLTTGVWYHLAATWDGGTERVYINAQEQGSRSVSGTMQFSGTVPIGIGATSQSGSPAWADPVYATLDGFKLYKRALSQAEIHADMNGSFKRLQWQENF